MVPRSAVDPLFQSFDQLPKVVGNPFVKGGVVSLAQKLRDQLGRRILGPE
jgi:hypothetical protein